MRPTLELHHSSHCASKTSAASRRGRLGPQLLLALSACALWLVAPSASRNSSVAFVNSAPAKAARGQQVALQARRFFVGGNWKANGSPASVKNLIEQLNAGHVQVDTKEDVEVVCSPPFVYLAQAKESLRSDYKVAAQNLWDQKQGAWTGEVPASMLSEMGVDWVILGHSERRQYCGETSTRVAEKTKFAINSGLSTITCIGEMLAEREGGKTFDVLAEQLLPLAKMLSAADWEQVVLAYEPVWAIGTGKVATPEQAEETHAFIRRWLKDNVSPSVADKVRILYGGSVNDANSAALAQKENIDGFLVGGASLKGDAFTTIVNSAQVAAVTL